MQDPAEIREERKNELRLLKEALDLITICKPRPGEITQIATLSAQLQILITLREATLDYIPQEAQS